MSGDNVSVLIPRNIYEKIRRRVELSQGEFKSVEEYVGFVLSEIVSEEEAKKWLNALDEKENRKKHKMKMIPGGRYHNEKDW